MDRKETALEAERRRQRVAMATHIASALIRTWKEDDPNGEKLAAHTIRLTDRILERLEETERRE